MMFKFVIAGVTAIALTFSSVPAQARGLSEDDIGKILFGLVAAGVLHSAINNNNSRRTTQAAPTPRTEQVRPHRGQSERRVDATRILPRACLTRVATRYGEHRMFGRRCLQRNNVNLRNLPRECAVRVRSNGNARRGFDPQCMRDAGYRIRRH